MAKFNLLLALILLFVFHYSKALYVPTPLVKACTAEINANEDELKAVMEQVSLPEDNEMVQKYGVCVFKGMLTDDHKLVANEAAMKEFNEAVGLYLGGKPKLAELISHHLIKVCSDIDGPSQEIASVRIINCVRKEFVELVE